ncbi:MAG: pilus assembly protein PilW [Dechloromonas sp.]|nr:pilus assembly protein PilW [Dechloromonas sp.]
MKPAHFLAQRGLALIELMIAMVIGLLLIIGVGNIFLSNQHAFRASENLAGVQDNARIAFELLSRELREAGSNPCGAQVIVNALNPSATPTIADSWATPVRGYDNAQAYTPVPFGSATGNRVANTDAIMLVSGSANNNATIVEHQVTSAQFKVSSTDHGLKAGDIVMACNNKVASIFQVTNASSSSQTIVHNSGTGTPGNCTKGLGMRDMAALSCTKPLAYLEDFTGGSFVAFKGGFWYIGINSRGGRSLFRYTPSDNTTEEMVDNVTDMQIQYLTKNPAAKTMAANYVDASSITDWSTSSTTVAVVANLNLTLETRDKIDTTQSTAATVKRNMFSTVQVRARESL